MTATHRILLTDARSMLSLWMAMHPDEVQPVDHELIARLDAAIEESEVVNIRKLAEFGALVGPVAKVVK